MQDNDWITAYSMIQLTIDDIQTQPGFDGPAYDARHDFKRLTGQIERIFSLMSDGKHRTLDEISRATGDPPASVSAQLRHMRKPRFGSHCIEKARRGDPSKGLWEYWLEGK